jgi:hypothetical protein
MKKKQKRNFSSFDLARAFKELNLTRLTEWNIDAQPVAPSEFYFERLRRMQEAFDITASERGKEVLIDAICEEALVHHPQIKLWKGAAIQSDDLNGTVDYVAAPNRGYLDDPLLCIVEAKKDDFEQGLAQCLVEMKACQWRNDQAGNRVDIYGIVTNGTVWQFYKLARDGQVYETLPYALINLDRILGALNFVFAQCAKNIQAFSKAA